MKSFGSIAGKPGAWKTACAVFLLCAATAITAQPQVFTTLVNFNGANGANPSYESLVQGPDGNFYGTTSAGGAYNGGTVFTITSGGALKTLYNFCAQPGCADGSGPVAGLNLATDGNFYGTTSGGGANGNYGTVFKITPSGALTTLYSFCAKTDCTDGSSPTAALVQGTGRNFYGTTYTGGANNRGTVFKITSGGTLSTLYSFCAQANCIDGAGPWAGLVQAANGNFYGTTVLGGKFYYYYDGTVFKITPAGKLTTMHSFDWDAGDNDGGSEPYAGLIQASDGNFYGTTSAGGVMDCAEGCGTIFQMTPKGTVTTMIGFDGDTPEAGLVQATDGDFYGTTGSPGSIFKITPWGTLSWLHRFGGPDDGSPNGGLLQATNGIFYGTTSEGGDYKCKSYSGCGTIFSLSMGFHPFVSFVRNPAKARYTFGVLGQALTGTTSVSLNGAPAAFTVVSDTFIKATVPAGGTTGFVTVNTPSGTLTSNQPFRVMPQLLRFDPPSGPVGTVVTIAGVSLTQTQGVGFGDYVPASFTVSSDTQVTATVPAGAQTGKVGIQTPGGTATSSAIFTVTQ